MRLLVVCCALRVGKVGAALWFGVGERGVVLD